MKWMVLIALGTKRQQDELTYRDVDYQANVNLLKEAIRAPEYLVFVTFMS